MKIFFEKIDSHLSLLLNSPKKRWLFFILIFIASSLIVISRRPDVVTNPQFYAEDGTYWYAEAYNVGPLKSIEIPKQGYLQIISRLGAASSLFFNIKYAPLALNLIAIIIQILPVLFLLSSRFDKIIPSYSFRILLCLIYLLLPHSRETHANLTNSQWRLAILMFLIVVAEIPKKIYWKVFDYAGLFITGLSGPFSIFILPIFLIYEYFSKKKKSSYLLIVSMTACIQLLSLFFNLSERGSPTSLDIGTATFFKILSGNVFIAGLFGSDFFYSFWHLAWWNNDASPILLGIIGLFLILYALRQAPLEMRLFFLFASMIFVAAIFAPQLRTENPQWGWEGMAKGSGNRYYFIPTLAWILALIWIILKGKNRIIKIFSGILISLLLFIGIPNDYKYEAFDDFEYGKQVNEFNLSPSGTNFEFKIYPEGWRMNLVKKQSCLE